MHNSHLVRGLGVLACASLSVLAGCSGGDAAVASVSSAVVAAAPVDIFDAASCTGTRLTQDAALAYFGATDTKVSIASYQVAARERTCSASGCSSWTPTNDFPFAQQSIYPTTAGGSGVVNYGLFDRTGSVQLSLVDGQSTANFESVQIALLPTTPLFGTVPVAISTAQLPNSFTPAPETEVLLDAQRVGHGLRVDQPRDVPRPQRHALPRRASTLPPDTGTTGSSGPLDGVITSTCVRIALTGTDGNTGAQVEAVFFATLNPPTAP